MYKIALCLSGQPRFYDNGFHYINDYVIKPNNCDVFIHTWYNPNEENKNYNCSEWNVGRSDIVKYNSIQKLKELYNPISVLVENPIEINFPNIENYSNRAKQISTFPMFYSIYKSNELKKNYEEKNSFTYDCVIRCRFDLKFYNEIKVTEYNLKTINAPDHLTNRTDAFPDMFGFSSSENMNIYSDVYNNIDLHYSNGCVLSNEDLLNFHLLKNKLSLNRIRLDCDYIRSR